MGVEHGLADPVPHGKGGSSEVLADSDLDALLRERQGLTRSLSDLELFHCGFVRGDGAALATREEVGRVCVAVDAGAVLDPVIASDMAGLVPFQESALDGETIAVVADAAFTGVASGEIYEFRLAYRVRAGGERSLLLHRSTSLSV